MTAREACTEWVRILRAVAAGQMSPSEALVRRPEVDDDRSVPDAFWSARNKLESEVEHGAHELPEAAAYFASEVQKLADRIERQMTSKP